MQEQNLRYFKIMFLHLIHVTNGFSGTYFELLHVLMSKIYITPRHLLIYFSSLRQVIVMIRSYALLRLSLRIGSVITGAVIHLTVKGKRFYIRMEDILLQQETEKLHSVTSIGMMSGTRNFSLMFRFRISEMLMKVQVPRVS